MESTAPLLEGRYQLSECVGAGGMATVYRAHDTALGRTVAVKMMRTGLEAAGARSARSESIALASLSHPGLVTLFDARFSPGGPEYLVMEYVDGPTLSDRMRRGPLPAADVAELGAELAEALHAVHSAGVVHRDVKPSNVLLAPSGTPGRVYRAKLADFGIAYLLGEARLTSPGVVIGTLSYLAPEQLRGAEPSPAADIYSLGLVLLEALTGERAFPASAPNEALAARHALTVELPDTLPSGWAALLRRMTADDPAARPSAIEVALEARAIAPPRATATATATATQPTLPMPADETTPAATRVLPHTAPLAAPAVAARPPRRRRLAAGLALAAAAVAVGGAFALDAFTPTAAPVVTEESVEPEAPAVVPPAPADDGATDPADSGSGTGSETVQNGPQGGPDEAAKAAEEERKRAEEAQKKAEEAQKKADEQARKDAEEAQKKAEETQKKADEQREKGGD